MQNRSVANITAAHMTRMSTSNFSDFFYGIPHKLTEGELKILNKPELLKILKTTSGVLKRSEETILLQSDAQLKSPFEMTVRLARKL